jgi:hypothetical protein
VLFSGPAKQGGAIEAECMCVLAAHMHEVQMHTSRRGGESSDGDREFGAWFEQVVKLGERGCYERALERDGSCTGKVANRSRNVVYRRRFLDCDFNRIMLRIHEENHGQTVQMQRECCLPWYTNGLKSCTRYMRRGHG